MSSGRTKRTVQPPARFAQPHARPADEVAGESRAQSPLEAVAGLLLRGGGGGGSACDAAGSDPREAPGRGAGRRRGAEPGHSSAATHPAPGHGSSSRGGGRRRRRSSAGRGDDEGGGGGPSSTAPFSSGWHAERGGGGPAQRAGGSAARPSSSLAGGRAPPSIVSSQAGLKHLGGLGALAWSPEEDALLSTLVQGQLTTAGGRGEEEGEGGAGIDWHAVSLSVPRRTAQQCLSRWVKALKVRDCTRHTQ